MGFALFHASQAPVLTTWLNWFASDAIGVVTVAPLIIGLIRSLRDLPNLPELVEGVLILAVLALASAIGFGWPTDNWFTVVPLAMVLPLLIWPAARCPPVFAAAAVFILGLVIVWTLTFSIGRLGDPSISLAQSYVGCANLVAGHIDVRARSRRTIRREAATRGSAHGKQRSTAIGP